VKAPKASEKEQIKLVRDGSSPEKAVILTGRRKPHVTKVWEWIASRHPACSMCSYDQALLLHGNAYVDSITITVSRRRRKTIYFQISGVK
jgi:hypothetical protein